jgi:hypothetical protein
MKFSTGQSCLAMVLVFALIVSVQNFQTNPIYLIFTLLVIATWFIATILTGKASAKKRLLQLEQQAVILDQLVANDFKVEDAVFSLEKDEVLIYHLDDVVLTEYRSTGSTYSGGYAGVSFRVAKGVRLNTGRTGGSSTRNPETPQPIDSGDLTVTNQRVVFSGANQVRVFDLDKVVNMEAGPNGLTVSISVSNREKTSGLESPNLADISPGMAVSLATAWHDGGKKAATKDAQEMAGQLRKAVADERAKNK